MKHSLYLHIPFCTHRCAYCDFNTYAGQQRWIPPYVAAICRELRGVGRASPPDLTVGTVYFGGGTPSLLSSARLAAILEAIHESFKLAPDPEITIECNPGTVSGRDFEAMRTLGVNRISLGVQSANGEELRSLERQHNWLDVLEAFSSARKAGFDNINLDLIYGLPEQPLEAWKTTLKRVLGLEPEHISAYALTLEHGAPFGRWHARGLLAAPDPDVAADMYEWASRELAIAGYTQYEISNWGRNGKACRHNLQYWRGLPYLGFGAGAHGYAGGQRYSNVLRIKTFIERLSRGLDEPGSTRFPLSRAAVNVHRQTDDDEMAEYMITGLRLTAEGIDAGDFAARFGRELHSQYSKELSELVGLGLVEWAHRDGPVYDGRSPERQRPLVRLTRRGRLLGNQVFLRFVN